nr:oxygenase MpaB family protein [Streptomyces sp. DSM 41633]
LWPVLLPPLARGRRFVTIGLMPPDARAAIGLPWSAAEEKRLRRLCAVLRVVVPVLPERLRYLPRARAARAAHAAGNRSRRNG